MSASMASSRGGNGSRKRPRFRDDDEGEGQNDASSAISPEEDCERGGCGGVVVSRRRRKGGRNERLLDEEERTGTGTRRHLLRVASELNEIGAAMQRLDRMDSAAEFYRTSLAAAAEAEGGFEGDAATTTTTTEVAEDREEGDGETTKEDGGVSYLGKIRDGREELVSLRLHREREGRVENGGDAEGGLRLHRTILLDDPLPMEVKVDVDERGDEGEEVLDTAPSVAAAIAMHNLGVVHCLLGRLDRSSDMFESAVNLLSSTEAEAETEAEGCEPQRPLAGGPPHLYPVLMNNLGHVYQVRGRVDEATIAFGEALRLVQESLDLLDLEGEEEENGSDHQDRPEDSSKGGDPCDQGEVRKDSSLSEDECECETEGSAGHQDCSDGSSKEQREQVRRQDATTAVEVETHHADAVAAVRECAATVLYNRGHLHHAAGERDLAAECLIDALEYSPPRKNRSLLLNVVVHLNYIGRELHRIGRTDEALRVYREALAVRPRLVQVEDGSPRPPARSQVQPQGEDGDLEGEDDGRETGNSSSISSSSDITTTLGNGSGGSTLPSEVYSNMLLNVGYIHLRRGRFSVARDAFLGSLRLLRGALGRAHPLVVRLDVHTTRVLERLCGGGDHRRGGGAGGGAGSSSSSSSSESGDENIAAAA